MDAGVKGCVCVCTGAHSRSHSSPCCPRHTAVRCTRALKITHVIAPQGQSDRSSPNFSEPPAIGPATPCQPQLLGPCPQPGPLPPCSPPPSVIFPPSPRAPFLSACASSKTHFPVQTHTSLLRVPDDPEAPLVLQAPRILSKAGSTSEPVVGP